MFATLKRWFDNMRRRFQGYYGGGTVVIPPPPPSLVAPVNSSLPVISGSAVKGQTLNVTTGAWLNPTTGFAYDWKRGGVSIGASGSSYILVTADIGSVITCTVTASNAAGSTPATSAGTSAVIDLAPVNTVLPVITGTPTEGQTLSVSNGTWVNTPITYARQWLRNGSVIGGATGTTYVLVTADVGANISCAVTATNTGGPGSALSNSLGPVGGIVGPAILTAPELSGIPRENEAYWLSAGTWSGGSITSYAYKFYRDGVLASTVNQAGDALGGTWVAGDVGKVIAATVEATNSSGTGAPASAILVFEFPSDVITPATIGTISGARTSASGVLPMTFDLTATVYDSDMWELRVLASDGVTELYNGFKGIAEAELTSPFNVDLTGATDPAPMPPIPVLGANDTLSIRLVSGDWMGDLGATGVASNWLSFSPTDAAGHRYWKFNVTASASGLGPNLRELKTALTGGGANTATGRSYSWSSGANPSGTFAASHLFNGIDGDVGGWDGSTFGFPQWVIIDFGVNIDLHELKLLSHTSFMTTVPTAFTFASSNDGVSFASPVVNVSGLTWTADEIKTWSW